MIKKSFEKNFIYTGCQILNKDLFNEYEVEDFSVAKIWNELLIKQQLNGFESTNEFYHLTNLEIFKKLKGS
jgi:MurNAc alpha-1-phosphate uridylyltransferase